MPKKDEFHISSYSTAPGTRVFDVSKNGKTVRIIAQRDGTTQGGNVRYRLYVYGRRKPERTVYNPPRDLRSLKKSVINFVKDFKLV